MSEYSPLRDPVFLLTWQIHLSVVTLFAVLGIWAGMTRRPWYVAPTIFLALLWLFVPLEAPEPAVVLLLSVPVLALLCRVARRWLETPREESSDDSHSRWRFSLADLLWLTLIVGMTTALVMQIWRLPWKADWRDLVLFGACLISLSMFVLIAVSSRAWKRPLLTLAILFALLVAVWFAGVPLAEKSWLLLIDWDVLPLPMKSRQHLDLAYVLTIAEFLLFAALGVTAISPCPGHLRSRRTILFQGAATALLGAVSVGLAIVFIRMLDRPKAPTEQWPEVNEREAFWAILERHIQLNPKQESLDALRATAGVKTAQTATDLLPELDQVLRRGNIMQFDSRFDKPDYSTNVRSWQTGRAVVRMLTAQAKTDWQAGRRSEALTHNLLALRLAEAFQRRGIMVDATVGAALEWMALHHFAQIRAELTTAESQQIADYLDQLAADREPLDLLFARERYFADRAGGWRGRVTAAANLVLGGEKKTDDQLQFVFSGRDAVLSLMRTDLAIRRHQQRRRTWPENLLALVPEDLDAIPLDPFSQKPLVYRIAGDGFVLYSVGLDGVDDGGIIANWQQRRTPGYDLGFETSWY